MFSTVKIQIHVWSAVTKVCVCHKMTRQVNGHEMMGQEGGFCDLNLHAELGHEDSELPQGASVPPPGVNSAFDLTSTKENQRGKWISHNLTQIGNQRAWVSVTFAAIHHHCFCYQLQMLAVSPKCGGQKDIIYLLGDNSHWFGILA